MKGESFGEGQRFDRLFKDQKVALNVGCCKYLEQFIQVFELVLVSRRYLTTSTFKKKEKTVSSSENVSFWL